MLIACNYISIWTSIQRPLKSGRQFQRADMKHMTDTDTFTHHAFVVSIADDPTSTLVSVLFDKSVHAGELKIDLAR